MPKKIVYVCRDCSYIYDSDPGECPQCLGIIQEMEMLPRAAHQPNAPDVGALEALRKLRNDFPRLNEDVIFSELQRVIGLLETPQRG